MVSSFYSKAEWINHITSELEELEEGPKAEIHTDLLKTTLKKVSNWKTPDHDGIHGFWFKKFTSIHDRQALQMNKCLQTPHVPEWISKGSTTFSFISQKTICMAFFMTTVPGTFSLLESKFPHHWLVFSTRQTYI